MNRRLHNVDFLAATTILKSGNNYGKLALWAQMMNMKFISASTFHDIQSTYLVPIIDIFWEEHKHQVLVSFRDQSLVVLEMSYPTIKHSHDIWHVAKNVGKKIMKSTWRSVLHHITNTHEWILSHGQGINKCLHEP